MFLFEHPYPFRSRYQERNIVSNGIDIDVGSGIGVPSSNSGLSVIFIFAQMALGKA